MSVNSPRRDLTGSIIVYYTPLTFAYTNLDNLPERASELRAIFMKVNPYF